MIMFYMLMGRKLELIQPLWFPLVRQFFLARLKLEAAYHLSTTASVPPPYTTPA
jgi:hypothetical protein